MVSSLPVKGIHPKLTQRQLNLEDRTMREETNSESNEQHRNCCTRSKSKNSGDTSIEKQLPVNDTN